MTLEAASAHECATGKEMSAPAEASVSVARMEEGSLQAAQWAGRSQEPALQCRGSWKEKRLHEGVMSSYLYVKMQMRTKTRWLDYVMHYVTSILIL